MSQLLQPAGTSKQQHCVASWPPAHARAHLSRNSTCGVCGSSSPSAVSSCGTTAAGSWLTSSTTWSGGVLQPRVVVGVWWGFGESLAGHQLGWVGRKRRHTQQGHACTHH